MLELQRIGEGDTLFPEDLSERRFIESMWDIVEGIIHINDTTDQRFYYYF